MHVTTQQYAKAALYGLSAGVISVVLLGIPSAVLANPWFSRDVPTRVTDYIALAIIVLLSMGLGATYAWPARCSTQQGKFTVGGLLSYLGISCPICNKIVVSLVGTSGALSWFAPIQPVLSAISIGVLIFTLLLRLQGIRAGRRLDRVEPVPGIVSKVGGISP